MQAMSEKMHYVRSYEARDEQGYSYTLREYLVLNERDGDNPPPAAPPGRRVLRTAGGQRLTRLKQGLYRIEATGQHLPCPDPHAP
jgi:hypothetical protein